MKAAVTWCGPAVTRVGSVSSRMPAGSDSVIQRSISKVWTGTPSMETSTLSPRRVRPKRNPVGDGCSSIWKTYSPSAGKTCLSETPPRVPKGAPSARSSCEAVRGIL